MSLMKPLHTSQQPDSLIPLRQAVNHAATALDSMPPTVLLQHAENGHVACQRGWNPIGLTPQQILVFGDMAHNAAQSQSSRRRRVTWPTVRQQPDSSSSADLSN
ncbi:hypothetical protein Q7C36_021707 [Tachysurus vachellii]|uniref:Uncharacterized protein n=1 Tax=Tachysurus vachellii TaxID=175792 RepID=A0AA88IQI1_TACVA|nr:hypothetical protein Q7C36_021707 [Tachysurus vachellii]